MPKLDLHIPELEGMKKYPATLSYKGKNELLRRNKISIIGSRRPSQYTQQMTYRLASALAKRGLCIVSGAAMGVDATAHRGAGMANTIAVLPSGIEIRYPVVNTELIIAIEEQGLTISQFDLDFRQTPWSFVVRNELVVALGDALIVTQADLGSGSMRSVEFALKMGKQIYVLPHQIAQSEGTNQLLAEGKAEAIYDIEAFANRFAHADITETSDPLLYFCKSNPSYEEAVKKFGETLFAYELEGKVEVVAGRVIVQ